MSVRPLPQIKPYETFTYEAQSLRSPFQPVTPSGRMALSLKGISSVSDTQPKWLATHLLASVSSSSPKRPGL